MARIGKRVHPVLAYQEVVSGQISAISGQQSASGVTGRKQVGKSHGKNLGNAGKTNFFLMSKAVFFAV
jgi:hypothetical protein